MRHNSSCPIEYTEKLSEFLNNEMDKVVEKRKEGLMLKAMSSPYMLGERSRSTKYWMKLKPEYMDTLAGYLDLIVLGILLIIITQRRKIRIDFALFTRR